MHRFRIQSLALVVAGISVARPLCAQGRQQSASLTDAPQTHTVKKGDNLWDLAKSYLGDAFLWPEIYRLNTDKIEDPHWIYPGELLKLPASGTTVAKAAAPANAPASAAPSTPSSFASAPVAQNPVRTQKRMTVFNPLSNVVERQGRESLNLRPAANAVRLGEYQASPFVSAPGALRDAGILEEVADAQGISLTVANRPVQYLEQVFVRLPKGSVGVVGDRYLVVRRDSMIEGHGQVVVPTGIIKLTAAGTNGRSRAELEKKFEDVFQGQIVVPMDTLQNRPGVMPARVEFGLATHVLWLGYNPVLPGSGSYLVLAATSKDGMTPGDQVTLMRTRDDDSRGVELPDEPVAIAEVTRVSPYGTAAIIVRTLQPGVAQGMKARVTAKMP
jgi:LysM repeat protein